MTIILILRIIIMKMIIIILIIIIFITILNRKYLLTCRHKANVVVQSSTMQAKIYLSLLETCRNKRWACKDDTKLLKYYDLKVKLSKLPYIWI